MLVLFLSCTLSLGNLGLRLTTAVRLAVSEPHLPAFCSGGFKPLAMGVVPKWDFRFHVGQNLNFQKVIHLLMLVMVIQSVNTSK